MTNALYGSSSNPHSPAAIITEVLGETPDYPRAGLWFRPDGGNKPQYDHLISQHVRSRPYCSAPLSGSPPRLHRHKHNPTHTFSSLSWPSVFRKISTCKTAQWLQKLGRLSIQLGSLKTARGSSGTIYTLYHSRTRNCFGTHFEGSYLGILCRSTDYASRRDTSDA